ncbi:hypothetical protein GCM10010221_47540 [Streptomyces parvus]|nr:hypothetical protein GCM10010221_47540 [Streptomyces parvus]
MIVQGTEGNDSKLLADSTNLPTSTPVTVGMSAARAAPTHPFPLPPGRDPWLRRHAVAPPAPPTCSAFEESDLDSLPPLPAQIDTALVDHTGVILDANGITFADSTLLRLLPATHQRTDRA